MQRVPWVMLAVLLGWAAAASAATVSNQPTLPVISRGQTVTIYGDGFLKAPIKVYLRTGKEAKGDLGYQLDGTASDDQKTVTFKLPEDTPTGDFLVFLGLDGQELPVPGELRIVPDASAKVNLDFIAPATDYLSPGSAGFDFILSGQNLARRAADNTVIAVGYGPLSVGSDAECANRAAMNQHDKICLSYDAGMEGQKLKVMNYHPRRYEGPVSFEVKVGNNVSNAQKITFSGMRAETLRFVAIGVFLGLAGMVFGLVLRGVRENRLAGDQSGPLAAFFLDRQTNSFSLSKFQMIAWTTVSIFGFVYLYLCRTYVQWNFSFPPIPEGLPTLLGVSAGTTVAAMGITVQHGSKGAGPIHPSMADFISSGGIIAGERFQFFVWTLVGCLGFLGIILSSDPASLSQMPDVQGPFLTLMGISSAGYLAGKLVRAPGPIISLLSITDVTPPIGDNPAIIRIEIKGQNLSDSSVVKIDKQELRIDQFQLKGLVAQDQPAGYYSSMEVDLLDAEQYLVGSHLIFLVNDDGQSACESFPLNPLVIDAVAAITAGTAPMTLHLVGRNFADGFNGTWVDAGNAAHTIPAADIRFIDANHLDVTFIPGPAGTGTLVLETQANLLGKVTLKVS